VKELRATGLVTRVATGAEARALRDDAVQRDEFAAHAFRMVNVRADRPQREPLDRQIERMRQRCRRYSVAPAELERLDAVITAAPREIALAMLQLIDVCIADTGFLLVIVDDSGRVRLPPSFVEAAQSIFDRELLAEVPRGDSLSVRLERPAPRRLERSLDHDLLRATLDDGDSAIAAWRAWRGRTSIDETVGFGEIAPMLAENLSRLGVDDPDMGRINGIRRRAWYLNELLTREAATVVDELAHVGIVPVLLGELPAAVRAASTRTIRPVHSIDLCVRPDEVTAAADALARHAWGSGSIRPITPQRLEQRTWQRFRIDPGRVLFLHWWPLPQHCSHLVAPEPLAVLGRATLNGTEVATLSPTAELLRCWARTGDPRPGHQLRTLCDTADIVERCSGRIDWGRLWSECARLELVDYGEMYLQALPGGAGAVGLRELRSLSAQ
jgi:hypothetical protein